MTLVTNREGLVKQLELAGVPDAPNAGQVTEEIQRVYVVDDLREILKPIPPLRTYTTVSASAPGAGDRALIRLLAPANGPLIVEFVREDSGSSSVYIRVQSKVATSGTETLVNTQGFTTGGTRVWYRDAVSYLTVAQYAAGQFVNGLLLPANAEYDSSQIASGILVQPGQEFQCACSSAATAMQMSFFVRTIPT